MTSATTEPVSLHVVERTLRRYGGALPVLRRRDGSTSGSLGEPVRCPIDFHPAEVAVAADDVARSPLAVQGGPLTCGDRDTQGPVSDDPVGSGPPRRTDHRRGRAQRAGALRGVHGAGLDGRCVSGVGGLGKHRAAHGGQRGNAHCDATQRSRRVSVFKMCAFWRGGCCHSYGADTLACVTSPGPTSTRLGMSHAQNSPCSRVTNKPHPNPRGTSRVGLHQCAMSTKRE